MYFISYTMLHNPHTHAKHFKIVSKIKICLKCISGHDGRRAGRPSLFQAQLVDRPVNRAFLAVGVHAVHIVGRPDRSTVIPCDRPTGRPTAWSLLSGCAGRPEVKKSLFKNSMRSTEQSTGANGYLPSALSVDRQLSRLAQWLYFGSVLFFMDSNGYFLFPSG